jgi:hypothetical protein
MLFDATVCLDANNSLADAVQTGEAKPEGTELLIADFEKARTRNRMNSTWVFIQSLMSSQI